MIKKWFITIILYVIAGQLAFASLPEQIPQIDPSFRQELARAKEKRVRQLLSLRKQTITAERAWDVIYYSLNLTPDPETEILYGEVEIAGIVGAASLNKIGLSCWSGLNIVSITPANNPDLNLKYLKKIVFDIVIIDLEREYTQGEQFSIKITYNGKPQDSNYYAFDFSNYGHKPMIWTMSEPFGARSWWPCKDVPSDKADSVDIRITVPNEFIAVSNGTLREKIINGESTTWWWHEQYPIATYLVSLAIYPYEVHYDNYLYNNNADTMKIHFYNFPGLYKQFEKEIKKVKHMITLFANLFGEYPFVEEKYGHADFLSRGAMEHQTCSSFGFWGEEVFVHELAHQWWGDLITCKDFHHIWLNEGFATYCEALWFEGYYANMTASEYQMRSNLYLGPGTIFVEDPENENIFDGGLSYSKGSWVLHMLRHIVSDSVFFDILQTYYDSPKHQYGTATTEDFQAICERVSGKELGKFFQQWIYDEWHPEYYFTWNWDDLGNGQFKVYGNIKQTQKIGPIFEMPLDITIQTKIGDTTFVLFNDEKNETFEYIVNAKPELLLLDKDNWILKKVSGINSPIITLNDYFIDDSNMNDNGRADANETVKLIVELLNTGLNTRNIGLDLQTDDPDIKILQNSYYYAQIDMNETVNNQAFPFEFNVAPNTRTHFADFKLILKSAYGYSDSLDFVIPINLPDILFVDDDAGKKYEQYIGSVLDKNYIPYRYWDVNIAGMPDLSDAQIVIWATGDDRDSTLTSKEQQLLSHFLDNGGCLLLSGQNIGYDLVGDGLTTDSLFYINYLHASFIHDNIESPLVLGVEGSSLGDGIRFYLKDYVNSAGNQKSTDNISPVNPAQTFLQYSTKQESAGINYYDEVKNSQVVYLAFGLEGISQTYYPDSVRDMFYRIIEWFANPAEITGISTLEKIPTDYYLYQNYPNPFNPETTIKFDLPVTSFVTLDIYNISGRKVKSLVSGVKSSGNYKVIWDGCDDSGQSVSSGVYFYKLIVTGFSETRKMLLLR